MQINDKIKDVNNDQVEYGNICLDINLELDKAKPNILVLKNLFEQKEKVWRRRNKHMEELQTLVNKINADWSLKLERHWPSKE